jgi:hypothetical protein
MEAETISCKAREALLSSVFGAVIVLLLLLLRATDTAPQFVETLLLPGVYVARITGHTTRDAGMVLVVVSDEFCYGCISLLLVQMVHKARVAFH